MDCKGYVLCFQLVWNNTRQFGFGTAKSSKYGFLSVARYSPRGNMGGYETFKENVFPPGMMSCKIHFLIIVGNSVRNEMKISDQVVILKQRFLFLK